MSILQVLLTVLVIIITAYLIVKKYNSVLTFLVIGMVVLLGYSLVTKTSVMGDSTCGNIILDVFLFVETKAINIISGMGLIIMTVMGYAAFMNYTQASVKLAQTLVKPLSKLKNPYVILSFMLVVGCFIKLVITSATGISILFMVMAFPILVSLGVSKASAAVTMILVAFLDWGPNDSSAVFASVIRNGND